MATPPSKAQRMAMIPEYMVRMMETKQKLKTAPQYRVLTRLDGEMKAILDDPKLPMDVKVRRYDQVLQRYTQLAEQVQANSPEALLAAAVKKRKPVAQVEEQEEVNLPTPPSKSPGKKTKKKTPSSMNLPTPPSGTPKRRPTKPKRRTSMFPPIDTPPQDQHPGRIRWQAF